MKRLISLILVTLAGLVIWTLLETNGKADGPRQERATVEFKDNVKLFDVILKGRYLFVHDDSKMALGEPCFYVYQNGRLITSFHCKSTFRTPSEKTQVIISRTNTAFDLPEVKEIQFAGFTKVHQTP